jgi:hypothetical protein
MGYWGAEIFEGDDPADMRDAFHHCLEQGLTHDQATEKVLKDYEQFFDSDPNLIFALAELQMRAGYLQPDIYHRARRALDSGADQRMGWSEELREERKRVLTEFEERIKNFRPRRLRASKLGEIFYRRPSQRL